VAVDDEPPQGLEAALSDATRQSGFSLQPVLLSNSEIEKYYFGFSNEIIWPQFHDLLGQCNFDCSYWPAYQDVNRKFADVIIQHAAPDDYVWVHDYHLMTVAQALRGMGMKNKIGFFLHIPFPPLDIFMKLPWRFQLLRSLLYFDLIGFQTLRDQRNFKQCVQTLISEVSIHGKGQVASLDIGDHHMRIGAFPISIDFNEFAHLARDKDVIEMAEEIVQKQFPDKELILGIDRLDYTKGIPERIQAFGKTLQRYPELHGKVTFVQIVVPSRYQIPEYQELKDRIERLISEINGRFGRVDWTPIHYFYRSLSRPELVAYYRAADILLVTSLKDGMNLIAKEYCAATVDNNGLLILSEFAGATAQMQNQALLVNPHDREGVADAIYNAVQMPRRKRRERMKKLRAQIKKRDIYWWVNSFLNASIAKSLNDFSIIDDYQPQLDLTRKIPERRRRGNLPDR
jgi:trehalose 6-phosphate synthase